jgi:hypothetical protein
MGYREEIEALPVKAGDTVTIPKGTLIQSGREVRQARRTYKVKVRHVQPGYS